jgi:hypothetical protein
MFRLDNLLERWAELYRPLSHNGVATTPVGSATTPAGSPAGSNKSFFRIGMIDAQSYFMRNFSSMGGACMAYATHVDAEINKQNTKALSYRHVIYFLIKQPAGTLATNQVTDEMGPTEARFQTDDMVQDLLAVLFTMKSVANGKSLPSSAFGSSASEVRAFIEDTASDPTYRDGLRGLQLEEAHWGTLPPVLNGWQICGLTIEQIAPRLLCVNAERYVQTEETE